MGVGSPLIGDDADAQPLDRRQPRVVLTHRSFPGAAQVIRGPLLVAHPAIRQPQWIVQRIRGWQWALDEGALPTD